jgi:hypothetical protein
MFRRPLAARQGPGLLRTVARTAVISATATAVSGAVEGRMQSHAGGTQRQQAAEAASLGAQAELERMKAQMAALQAQQVQAAAAPAPAASAGGGPELIAQLQQLAQLKEAGALSDAEFAAAKAKLLGI